jgi:hypothetical protein
MKQDPFLSHHQLGNTNSYNYSSLECETLLETQDELPGLQSGASPIRRMTTSLSECEGEIFLNTISSGTISQMDWSGMQMSNVQFPKSEYSYDFSPSNTEKIQDDLSIRQPDDNITCEYIWPQAYGSRNSMSIHMGHGCPSEYQFKSPEEISTYEIADLHGLDYATEASPGALQQLRIGNSPTMENQRSNDGPLAFENTPAGPDTSSSHASDDGDGDSGDGNISVVEDRISDEPYAKLIYRALLAAPNHSMVLQEIYQWFIDHTDKANSTSTGWRNSIRHNLSMNAVSNSML